MILLLVTLISISASANLTGPDNTPFTGRDLASLTDANLTGSDVTSLADPDLTSLTAPVLTGLAEVIIIIIIIISNATQSSNYYHYTAGRAVDGDISTQAATMTQTSPWIRVYFNKYSKVDSVVIEKSYTYISTCTYTVFVYDTDKSSVCGTYTKSKGFYYNETVQCGGRPGHSVMLQAGCTQMLNIFEMKVYRGQNLCGNITCQNNGTCDGTTGKCNCTNDYTGDRCENNKDRCWNTTCQNKGTCDSTTGKCNCTNSYTGDTCENEDMCWNITCQNKGDCDGTTGKCNCPISYRGDSCQEKCDKKCRNGRVCYWRDPETQGCRCPALSYGTGCSKKADCSLTERNICGRMKGNNPEKFTKKCKRNWGKKKCPISCGYCRANQRVGWGGFRGNYGHAHG